MHYATGKRKLSRATAKVKAAHAQAKSRYHHVKTKLSHTQRRIRAARHAYATATDVAHPKRDPVRASHRGNADLIRWYLKHAHEVERSLFAGPGGAERRQKARAIVANNVRTLRRVQRAKALGFIRTLGYPG